MFALLNQSDKVAAQMVILISNDDGVRAKGLEFLANVMRSFGKVVIVAPDREQSGASHSLTLHRPLRIFEYDKDVYAVDGTPTDCVSLGVQEILKQKPDLLVSGINHGANLGEDVTYSGTVSAAMEGTIFSIPSIAFSLVSNDKAKLSFDHTKTAIEKIVQALMTHTLPEGFLLNVNFPAALKKPDLFEHEITFLGRRRYAGATVEKIDPKGRKYYWIGGEELDFENRPGSDSNAIAQGKVSISPICIDLSAHHYINKLKAWEF